MELYALHLNAVEIQFYSFGKLTNCLYSRGTFISLTQTFCGCTSSPLTIFRMEKQNKTKPKQKKKKNKNARRFVIWLQLFERRSTKNSIKNKFRFLMFSIQLWHLQPQHCENALQFIFFCRMNFVIIRASHYFFRLFFFFVGRECVVCMCVDSTV